MGSVLEQPFQLLLIKSNKKGRSLHQCYVRPLFLSTFVKMLCRRKAESSSLPGGKNIYWLLRNKKNQLRLISIMPLFLRACGQVSSVFQTARGHLAQLQHRQRMASLSWVNANQGDPNVLGVTALEIQPCLQIFLLGIGNIAYVDTSSLESPALKATQQWE